MNLLPTIATISTILALLWVLLYFLVVLYARINMRALGVRYKWCVWIVISIALLFIAFAVHQWAIAAWEAAIFNSIKEVDSDPNIVRICTNIIVVFVGMYLISQLITDELITNTDNFFRTFNTLKQKVIRYVKNPTLPRCITQCIKRFRNR